MDFLLRDDNSGPNEPVRCDEGASGIAFWGRKRRSAPRCSLSFLTTHTRSVRAFAHSGMSVHSSCKPEFSTRTAPIASAPYRFIVASPAAPGGLGTDRRGLQHGRQRPYGRRRPEGRGPASLRGALLPAPPTGDLEREYLEVYYPIDERVARVGQLPDSRLVQVTDLCTAKELKSSPTYNEMFRCARHQNSLIVRLDGTDGSHMAWAPMIP